MENERPTLTQKQEWFCREYIIDLNATQAAKRAGYSEASAGSIGGEILQKPEIQNRINELQAERSKRVNITADEILRDLMGLKNSNVTRLFDENGSMLPMSEWPEELARCVASVEVEELFEGKGEDRKQVGFTRKVKFWDKTKALEMIARHLKMFTDRIEFPDKDGNPQSITQPAAVTITDPVLAAKAYAELIADRPKA